MGGEGGWVLEGGKRVRESEREGEPRRLGEKRDKVNLALTIHSLTLLSVPLLGGREGGRVLSARE